MSCDEFTTSLSFVDEIALALESMPIADLALKEKLSQKQHEPNASLSEDEEATAC